MLEFFNSEKITWKVLCSDCDDTASHATALFVAHLGLFGQVIHFVCPPSCNIPMLKSFEFLRLNLKSKTLNIQCIREILHDTYHNGACSLLIEMLVKLWLNNVTSAAREYSLS